MAPEHNENPGAPVPHGGDQHMTPPSQEPATPLPVVHEYDNAHNDAPVPFNASAKPTLGIEWEIALLDSETLNLTPRASEVLAAMSQIDPDHRAVQEFLSNTIELVTGVAETVPAAVSDLKETLDIALRVADSLGISLYSQGTHPFAHWGDQELSDKGNYQQIVERTQWWGRQMVIWGIHVHVGVSDKERVWPIIRAMLTLYPHILALSASSPAWEGADTGYASNRTLLYQQLPTAGLPYQMESWQEWEAFTRDQLRSGVIDKPDAMHLDIRPAGKWGTVEVRFADATTNLRELGAIAAFIHCAVVYFDRLIDAGETLPYLQQWHVAENKWRAARYGLDALIIVDRDTHEKWVRDDIRQWVERLSPIAEEVGCRSELEAVLSIIDAGAGYERRRREARAAGAALEPGARLAGEKGAQDGFASPEAWHEAVRCAVEEMRGSI